MVPADNRRRHEALDWVRRIHDPDFADWDEHVAWLEESAANSALFDAASLDIEAASAHLSPARRLPTVGIVAPSANDNGAQSDSRGWKRFAAPLGFGIAAATVGAVSLPALLHSSPPLRYRTAPGEQRVVRLPDGTRMSLNGDTAVEIDRADPRLATLTRGEALFAVVHDPDRPFTVHAGDAVFRDVGTVFDVVRAGPEARLAVREGAVMYDPDGAKLQVGAGQSLRLANGGDATLRPVAAASVGGWSVGRLTYAGAPIGDVAADLARATGHPVSVDADARARRFSGVIVLDRDGSRLARRVTAVTGLAMTPDGPGWRMALPAR